MLHHLHLADEPWHRKVQWAKHVAKYAAGHKLEFSLLYPFSYEIVFIRYNSF